MVTKVRLGSTALIGASIVAVSRGRCRRIGVPWGSQVFSEVAGAQCVSDLVKSGRGGHIETVAIDPTGTWDEREGDPPVLKFVST